MDKCGLPVAAVCHFAEKGDGTGHVIPPALSCPLSAGN